MPEPMHLQLKDCVRVTEDWGQMHVPPGDRPSFAHCVVTSAGVIEFAEHHDRQVLVLSGHGLANIAGYSFPLTVNDILQIPHGIQFEIEPIANNTITVLIFHTARPAP